MRFASVAELALLFGLGRLSILALHRAIPTDWKRAQRVERSRARARPAQQFRPHSNRELVDAHAGAARDDIVAELVQNHKQREHGEKRYYFFGADEVHDG